MQPQISKKLQISIVTIILGLVIFMVYWLLIRTAQLTIQSESGAAIFVATERGGEFKKIGTSTATYKSRASPITVYVMSAKDGKKTVSSGVAKKGQKNSLKITLAATKPASMITNTALSSPYINNGFGQGILPSQFTLTRFKIGSNENVVRPEFVGLPYMKKIVWLDENNFTYVSFKEGAGNFINGEPLFSEGVGTNIIDNGFIDEEVSDYYGDDTSIIDISKTASKPLVLLTRYNLFTSSDVGATLTAITKLKLDKNQDDDEQFLFTTQQYIYIVSETAPSAYASESQTDDESESGEEQSKALQYDYAGKFIKEVIIPDHKIIAATDKGNTSYLLGSEKLFSQSNKKTSELDLYFEFVRDIITYKDTVVMLADNGLWQIADDGVSMQLLYEFKDNGIGLAKSLVINKDALLFGTQSRPDDPGAEAATFSITF